MGRKIARYADEFRLRMIELVRAGRSPESLAKEFEPSAQTIRNWVAQDDRERGNVIEDHWCRSEAIQSSAAQTR